MKCGKKKYYLNEMEKKIAKHFESSRTVFMVVVVDVVDVVIERVLNSYGEIFLGEWCFTLGMLGNLSLLLSENYFKKI